VCVYVGLVRRRLSKVSEEARRHSSDRTGQPAVRLLPGSGARQAGASGVRRLRSSVHILQSEGEVECTLALWPPALLIARLVTVL
jgi:hypothetical protein